MTHPLQATIEELWERRTELSPQSPAETIALIESVIGDLDSGKLRVAEKIDGDWFTHQRIKKAVLLSFRIRDNRVQDGGDVRFYDKVDTKFQGWTEEQFRQGGFRVVPGTIVRKGSYVAKNAVLMPSF
ncbi:MAG: 2,3,4,5-tetrahydropyridine-2,6-dicarboxylate N-succinyltransferase, partial [Azonexus sp.]